MLRAQSMEAIGSESLFKELSSTRKCRMPKKTDDHKVRKQLAASTEELFGQRPTQRFYFCKNYQAEWRWTENELIWE